MKIILLLTVLLSLAACHSSKSDSNLKLAASCTPDTTYERALNLCSKFIHYRSLKICLSDIHQRVQAFSPECKAHYLSQTNNVLKTPISRVMSEIVDSNNVINHDNQQGFFYNIHQWYLIMEEMASNTIETDAKSIIGEFLALVNNLKLLQNLTTAQNLEWAAQLISDQFDVSVSSKFSLTFIDVLLEPVDERIKLLARIEDFHCAIEECSDPSQSRTYQNLLALTKFLRPGIRNENFTDTAIISISNILFDNRSLLQGWLPSGNFSRMDITYVPDDTKTFVSRFKNFFLMLESKEGTGFFNAKGIDNLYTGFDSSFRTNILRRLSDRTLELSNRINSFDATKRNELLTQISDFISNGRDIDNLDSSIRMAQKERDALNEDILGIEMAIADNTNSLEQYNRVIEDRSSILSEYFITSNVIGGNTPISVDATDAKYDGTNKNLSSLNIKKIEVEAGSLITISTTGTYSPSCAINNSDLFPDPIHPLFGPQGFIIDYTSGTATVSSVENGKTSVNEDDVYSGKDTCDIIPNGTVRESTCNGDSHHDRNTEFTNETTSESDRHDMTAHFTIGYRHESAPFFDFPAGSLLAFVQPRSNASLTDTKDVYVVGSSTQIFVEQNSDIYFVVNDCNNNSDTSNKLSLKVTKTIGAAEGRELMRQFIAALGEVERQARSILNEGTDITLQVNNLNKRIIANFALANGISFYDVPLLRDVFDFWLNNETLKIERMAKLKQLGREVEVVVEKLSQLRKDRASAETLDFVKQLRLQNILTNLDNTYLVDMVFNALDYAEYVALPMIDFHYPKALVDIKNQIQSIDTNVSDDFTSLFLGLKDNLDRIESNFSDSDSIYNSTSQTKYLVLRFPNPYDSFPGYNLGYPVSDLSRSKVIWDTIFKDGDEMTVETSINDFYRDSLVTGNLNCQNIKAVNKDMMMVMVAKQDAIDDYVISGLNSERMSVQVEFGPRLEFPFEDGPREYTLTDSRFTNKALGVGFIKEPFLGRSVDLLNSKSYADNTGIGLSPFTTNKLSQVRGLGEALGYLCFDCYRENFSDILFVYKVAFESTGDITWPRSCGSSTNPTLMQEYAL